MNAVILKGLVAVEQAIIHLRERATGAERGQGLVEYVLILAFVALAVIVAMKALQPAISHTFNQTACTLNSAGIQTPTSTPCP